MENKLFKRLSSLALVLFMVISMLPTPVFAASTSATCPCTGCNGEEAQWVAYSEASLASGGHYQLTKDETLSGEIKISSLTVIDLAGHTLTAAAGKRAFYISGSSAKLYLIDSSADNTGKLQGSGTAVASSDRNGYGGLVYADTSARFEVHNATVTGGIIDGERGGNIYANDSAVVLKNAKVLNGAIVRSTKAAARGANICMYGSKGILYVYGSESSISGGAITTSSSNRYGGGVYLGSGGQVYMYDGTIAPGTNATSGVAISVMKGTVYMYGGTVGTKGGYRQVSCMVSDSNIGNLYQYGGTVNGLSDGGTTNTIVLYNGIVDADPTTINSDGTSALASCACTVANDDGTYTIWNHGHGDTTTCTTASCRYGTALSEDAANDDYAIVKQEGTHSWGETTVTKEATCSAVGESTHTCTVCDKTETMEISKLAHTFLTYESDGNATCKADGTKTATCEYCTATDTVADVDSHKTVAHTYGPMVGGVETCTVCGNTNSCDHSYTDKVTAPTCTAQGYTTHTCSKCGDSYDDSHTDPADHVFTSYVSDGNATCTADGTKTAKCDTCGQVEETVTDTGSKLEHNYGAYDENGVKTCADCSATYTCTHEGTVALQNVSAATCLAAGYTGDYICSECGVTTQEGSATEQLSHSYDTEGNCANGCTGAVAAVILDGNTTFYATALEALIVANGTGATVHVMKDATVTMKDTFTESNPLKNVTLSTAEGVTLKDNSGGVSGVWCINGVTFAQDSDFYFNGYTYATGETSNINGNVRFYTLGFKRGSSLNVNGHLGGHLEVYQNLFFSAAYGARLNIYGNGDGVAVLDAGTNTSRSDGSRYSIANYSGYLYVENAVVNCNTLVLVNATDACTTEPVVELVNATVNVTGTYGSSSSNNSLRLAADSGSFSLTNSTIVLAGTMAVQGDDDVITMDATSSIKSTTADLQNVKIVAAEGVDGCVYYNTETGVYAVADHDYPEAWTEDTKTCENCSEVYTCEHSAKESNTTTEPTCTNKGVVTYYCPTCKMTWTGDIDSNPNAHTWSESYSSDANGHWQVCQNNSSHTSEVKSHTAGTWAGGKTNCTDCNYEMSCAHANGFSEEVTTNPTCAEKGEKTFTCKDNCGYSYTEEIAATGDHIYDKPKFRWEADFTCKATYACTGCQDTHEVDCTVTNDGVTASCVKERVKTYTATITIGEDEYTGTTTQTLAKLDHSYDGTNTCVNGCGKTKCEIEGHKAGTHYEAFAGDCVTEGWVEYWYCQVCSKRFADAECTQLLDKVSTGAGDHAWGEWTSNEDGTHNRECDINANHNIINETCTDENADNVCDKCGYVAGCRHEYEQGYCKWCSLSRCELENNGEHTKNLENYTVTTHATCTNNEWRTYWCDVCRIGIGEAEEIPDTKGEHVAGEMFMKAPTCSDAGYKTYYACSNNCGRYLDASYNEIGDAATLATWKAVGGAGYLDPLEHQFDSYVLKSGATCKSYAVYEATCTICGTETDSYEDVEGGYAPHDYTGENGVCQWCGGTQCDEYGHMWSDQTHTLNADKTAGTLNFYCYGCQTSKSLDAVVTSTGVIDEATCTEPGRMYYMLDAEENGENFSGTVQEEIAETGHSYTYTANGDGTHNGVCANDASHVVTNEACDEDGTDGACSKCGYVSKIYVAYIDADMSGYYTEGEVKYETLADAIAAVPSDPNASAPTMVTLLTNVTLTESTKIAAYQPVLLNLNGYSITGNVDSNYGMFYVAPNGLLMIADYNAAMSTKETVSSIVNNGGIAIGNYGMVAVTYVNVSGSSAALYNFYYNGSTYGFAALQDGAVLDTVWNSGNLSLSSDASVAYIDNSGALTISGEATVTELYLGDGSDAAELENCGTVTGDLTNVVVDYDSDNFKLVTENNVTSLVARVFVAEVNGTKYESLQDAINEANGATVTLLTNVTTDMVVIAAGTTVTLDLAGYDLTTTADGYALDVYGKLILTGTADSVVTGGICINDANSEVVMDTVTVQTLSTNRDGMYNVLNYGGKFTMNSGKLYVAQDADSVLIALWACGGTTVINGGEIVSDDTYNKAGNDAVYAILATNGANVTISNATVTGAGGAVCANSNATVTINGGTFTSGLFHAAYGGTGTVVIDDGTFIGSLDSNVAVQGGSFSKDATAFCGEGYHTVKDGEYYVYGAHSYSKSVVAPTCVDKGYTTYTCSCGDSYVADYTDATGEHDYTDGVCDVCGDEITSGYLLYILNGDGTVAMVIDGSKSTSDFSLKTAMEAARVFADNAFLFGITGTPSFVVEMYEDSYESASFTLGADVTVKGNGHNIVLADGVTLDASAATLINVTIVEPKVYVAEVNGTKYESLAEAIANANGGTVKVLADVEESLDAIENVTLVTDVAGGVTITNTYEDDYVDFNNVTLGSGVTLNVPNVYSSGSDNVIEGTLNVGSTYYHSSNATTIIRNGGKVTTGGMTVIRYNTDADAGIYVYGDGDDSTVEFSCANTIGAYSGTFYAEGAVVEANMVWLDYKKDSTEESDSYAQINAEFVDSKLNVASELRFYKDATMTLEGSAVTAGKVQIRQDATPSVSVDSASSVTASAVENLSGAALNAAKDDNNVVTFFVPVASVNGKNYATLQAAIDAAGEGDTVKLLTDTVVDALGVEVDKIVTIDLNNCNIESTGDVFVVTGGKLTINGNGNVTAGTDNDGTQSVIYACGGDVVINGGTYYCGKDESSLEEYPDHTNDAIYSSAGTIYIYGGTFSADETVWLLNCKDAAYNNGTAAIIVEGGEFKGFNPYNNAAEGADTNYVADGKHATDADGDGTYEIGEHSYTETVVAPTFEADGYTLHECACGDSYKTDIVAAKIAVAEVNGTKFETLQAAINAAAEGDTVTLLADVTENVSVSKAITLNGNAKTINGSVTITAAVTIEGALKVTETFYIYSTGNVTIAEGADVDCDSTFGMWGDSVITVEANAEISAPSLYINGGSVEIYGTMIAEAGADGGLILNAAGDTINVYEGGVLDVSYVDVYKTTGNSTVNVYGEAKVGFKMSDGSGKFTWNIFDGGSLNVAKNGIVMNSADSQINIEGDATATKITGNGTINLTTVGATLTTPETQNVATTVDGYRVVYENGVYSIKLTPKAHFETGAYADTAPSKPREFLAIKVYDVYAEESLVIKVYDENGDLIATTTYRDYDLDVPNVYRYPVNAPKGLSVNIVISGKIAGSWDTVWHIAPSVANIPAKFEVYVDGELKDTWTEGFRAESEKADYMAMEGVYKAASVTDAEGNVSYYATLQAAIDAAGEGETVTILTDIELTEGVVVAADKNIVLDLNGKTVSMSEAATKTSALITNNGTLTIKDSVGEGKLTYVSSTVSTSYSTSTIINNGTLTVESGTIENTSERGTGSAAYAIDNYNTLTVNGGVITAANTIAIRQAQFGNRDNTVTVTGGTISGGYAGMQIHVFSTAKKTVTNITGGTFEGAYAFYTSFYKVVDSSNTEIAISGGTFDGDVYLYNGNKGSYGLDNVSITDGTFLGETYVYTKDADGNAIPAKVITGGTFYSDVDEYCAVRYAATETSEGVWTIAVNEKIVAWNSETGVEYETVQAALNAAKAGEIVHLLTDVEESFIYVSVNKTLDLNGHTLTAETVSASFTTSHIIDSTDGEGLLKVAKENVSLNSGNEYLPIWTDEGARFESFEFKQNLQLQDNGDTAYFRFYIDKEAEETLVDDYLANGTLTLRIKATWTSANGTVNTQYFEVPTEMIQNMINSDLGWKDGMFYLKLRGVSGIENLSICAEVVSTANTQASVVVSGAPQS